MNHLLIYLEDCIQFRNEVQLGAETVSNKLDPVQRKSKTPHALERLLLKETFQKRKSPFMLWQ